MRKMLKMMPVLVLLSVMAIFNQCSKDEAPALTLVTITAGTSDLNGATAPSDVALNAVINATFSTDIDAASANSDNISLKRDYDDTVMNVSISVSGSTITITPNEDFGSGTKYRVVFRTGLKSTGGKALTAVIERAYTTIGSFAPAGAIAYWTFEDNSDDQIGDFNASPSDIIDISFTDSRNTNAGKAATFNGTTSIIEIPNGDDLVNTSDFALSFWVKTNSTDHLNADGNPNGHFVLGVGALNGFQFEIGGDYSSCKLAVQWRFANGNSSSDDLFFNGDGKTKDNGGWKGTEFRKDLSTNGGLSAIIKDQWTNVVCVFESSTKLRYMYINGQLMQKDNFNLFDDPLKTVNGLKFNSNSTVQNILAFGFIESRGSTFQNTSYANYSSQFTQHFKGQLDDVRIFHKVITAKEIELMYDSEK